MFRFLLEKEFKQIARNRFLPKLILVYPVVMMILMPWAANLDVKDIRLCVVDNDNSTYSRRLTQKASGSEYFKEAIYLESYNEAISTIERGECDIILEIPSDFEKDLVNGVNRELSISSNAVDGMRGSIAASYLAGVVNDFSAELIESKIVNRGSSAAITAAMPSSIEIVSLSKYNPSMDYKLFMVPGLIVIIITIIGGFLPALNIVSEKEAGTIEQINVTPVRKITFIFSKLIPYWVIGFIILTNTLILAKLLYGIVPVGSIFEFYLLSFLFLIVVSGLGLVISNNSRTMQQAMFVMFFFMLVMILLSGLFTPVSSMPIWAQVINSINPMKYFTEIMRMVFLKGSGLADLYKHIFIMFGFAGAFSLWAVLSYRKNS
ncbi:MAG: ABC transporter permease [Bacteroidetes bacterium HGW-Bacteroidetes-8]|nr:MAG: ABC transporter permease [Bacteroidetes bacterium HGW-Bacteroidetes-8]